MSKAKPHGWNTVRVIAVARAVSIFGDELAVFALLLREKHDGGGALSIAAILAAGQLPLIFLSPWAGMLADRIPVRRLAPIVNIIQAGFAALLVINGPLFVSLILVCLIGVGGAIAPAAWNATLPEIIDKEEMPRAMSLWQAFYALAGMAGPACVGIMISKLGYVTPMVADALTFVALAIVPFFLTLPFHARESGPRKRGDVWVGMQIVRKEPVIRALTILGFTLNVSFGMVNIAELFFTLDDLHSTTFVYGLVASFFSGSIVIASVVNQRRRITEGKLPRNIIVSAIVVGIGVIFNGLSWNLWVLFPSVMLAGAGVAVLNAYYMALILQRSPESSRGRILSAVTGVTTAGQLSSLAIGGVVVSLIDPRFAILISGVACLLTAVALSSSLMGASTKGYSPDSGSLLPVIDFPVVEPE